MSGHRATHVHVSKQHSKTFKERAGDIGKKVGYGAVAASTALGLSNDYHHVKHDLMPKFAQHTKAIRSGISSSIAKIRKPASGVAKVASTFGEAID